MKKEDKKLLTVAYCTIPEIAQFIDSFDDGTADEDLYTENNLIGKLVVLAKDYVKVKRKRYESTGVLISYIPETLPPGDQYGWSSRIEVRNLESWVRDAWNFHRGEMLEAWLVLPDVVRVKFLNQSPQTIKDYYSFIKSYIKLEKEIQNATKGVRRKKKRELYNLKDTFLARVDNFDWDNMVNSAVIYWPYFKKALMESGAEKYIGKGIVAGKYNEDWTRETHHSVPFIPCSLTFYPDKMLEIMGSSDESAKIEALMRFRKEIDTFVLFAEIYNDKGKYYRDEDNRRLLPDYIYDFELLLDIFVDNS